MIASFLSRPTISVTLDQESVYVHPTVLDCELWQENLPSRDPLLSGTVLISVPSPRAFNRIRVVLEGLCDAYGGDGSRYETAVSTLYKEVCIDLNGETLPEGKHAFNFSFIIPSSTATFQRCNFGRVRHFVKATASLSGTLGGSIATPSVAFHVVANPNQAGELPLPTNINIQHYQEDLGAVGIQINSPHLTVASLLSVQVTLPSPPAPVELKSINSTIDQKFQITFSDGHTVRPPVQKHLLTKVSMRASPSLAIPICTTECGSAAPESSDELGPAPAQRFLKHPLLLNKNSPPCCPPKADIPERDPFPLKVLQGQEEEFVYTRMFRCPTDDYIRPTTVEGSNNMIQVSHAIVVQIRYRVVDQPSSEPDKILTVRKPLSITSCCCLLDSLLLPAYSKKSPGLVIRPTKENCMCSLTLEAMLDRDGEALQRAGSIEEPTGDARFIGCNRSTKSPSYNSSGTNSYASSIVALPSPPLED